MQSKNEPGPDGCPAGFYKHFSDILFLFFHRVVNEMKNMPQMPTYMTYSKHIIHSKPR